jgi:hypothetical protein
MSELPPFMRTKEEAIAYTIAEIIADILRVMDFLYNEKYDTIPIYLRIYTKRDMETIERVIGKVLEQCRKQLEDVLRACRERNVSTIKNELTLLAKYVCIEPYQILAGSK